MNFKAGDIIIFKSDGSNPIIDYFIKFVSDNTHIGMFINDREFIEAANPSGVRVSEFKPEWKHIKVYRPPDWINNDFIDQAVSIAMFHRGDNYSVFQGVMAGVLRLFNMSEIADKIDRNWNCSEFIAYIIRYGMMLNFMPNVALQSILPDDIDHYLLGAAWGVIR